MAKDSLAGTRVRSPRVVADLVLWETEQRYCRTSVSVAGPVDLVVGTVLVDKTVSTSAADGLQPVFSDSICLKKMTIADGETAEVPVLVRGPALLNLDEVERSSGSETDAALKTRLADLRSQGVRFVREPANTADSRITEPA
jgi:hypothetical protein